VPSVGGRGAAEGGDIYEGHAGNDIPPRSGCLQFMLTYVRESAGIINVFYIL